MKSATNTGSDSWEWGAANGDIRMVQSTDDERYFAQLISEDRTSAGKGELRFNVSWSGTAIAEVFVYILNTLLGDGDESDSIAVKTQYTSWPSSSVFALRATPDTVALGLRCSAYCCSKQLCCDVHQTADAPQP